MKTFSGESWTCLSNESTITSKISNRCKHKSHSSQTHILSDFTRQFSSTNSQAPTPDMSNDDEWSSCSETDHLACNHSAHNVEGQHDFSRKSGLASCSVVSSQPLFKRPSAACPAAFEDPGQTSNMDSAPATTLRTEFFELSPPR